MRTNTARSILWNYAGYFYQIGISFGLTSYIVRRVSVTEYGLFLFIMALSATLYLLDMGLSNILVQAYVEASVSPAPDRQNALLNTAFISLAALGTIGVLVFFGIAITLPGPFKIPSAYLHEAFWIFIIAASIIQVSLPCIALEQIYQANHRFDRINQVQLATTTVQLILSVLVLASGYSILALALVQLCIAVLRLTFFVLALTSSAPGASLRFTRFDRQIAGTLFHASKWAFLNNLGTYIFDLLAWGILGSFGSMDQAALFGLANKPSGKLWNLVDKGATVALPQLSRFHSENDTARLRQTYLRTLKIVFGAVVPFVVLGSVFARSLILVWAGSRYAQAAIVMQWLLLATFTHAVAYPSDQLLYACGEVRAAAKITLWSGSISVIAALLLVSRYGAAGLAAGMALTQLLVNCAWFTATACRLSHTSFTVLMRALFWGLEWPLLLLALEVAAIEGFAPHLSPLQTLLAATLAGLLYLSLWTMRTALPLYRGRTETAA